MPGDKRDRYIQYSRRREGTDTEGQGGGTETREPQRHGIYLNISEIIHRVRCKLKHSLVSIFKAALFEKSVVNGFLFHN